MSVGDASPALTRLALGDGAGAARRAPTGPRRNRAGPRRTVTVAELDALATGHVTTVEGIRRALGEATARRTAKSELVAVEVLEELRRVVFFDIGCLFDAYGNLRPLVELTVEERSAIAGIDVISKNAAAHSQRSFTPAQLRLHLEKN